MTEDDLMTAVTEIASLLGWSWVHFRPAQTASGWRTPVSGPLGKGWPDLEMIRGSDGRHVYVELKSATGRLTPDQVRVHLLLAAAGMVYVWRPSDLDDGTIERALR